MIISAKCILMSYHSIAELPPIITMQLEYPRYIHAEFMTHRVFSRNASSSRAVPTHKLLERIRQDPVYPSEWGKARAGMQSDGPMNEAQASFVKAEWDSAKAAALEAAERMAALGAHKQVINRILEPYSHISVIVTATEWDNFFSLRLSHLADPTMRALAEAMAGAMSKVDEFQYLEPGEWHLPYVTDQDRDWASKAELSTHIGSSKIDLLANLSVARCARVSYLTHDGQAPDREKDIELAYRLLRDRHMSPFEHPARASSRLTNPLLHANFRGWDQYRHLVA